MSKIIKAIAMGAIAVSLLGGCMSSGNRALKDQTNESMKEQLKEGMTQAEVRAMLGDPLNVSFTDGGQDIWNYEFTEAQMTAESFIPYWGLVRSGSKGTKKQLVILFDEAATVKKFTMSDSAVETRSGILR